MEVAEFLADLSHGHKIQPSTESKQQCLERPLTQYARERTAKMSEVTVEVAECLADLSLGHKIQPSTESKQQCLPSPFVAKGEEDSVSLPPPLVLTERTRASQSQMFSCPPALSFQRLRGLTSLCSAAPPKPCWCRHSHRARRFRDMRTLEVLSCDWHGRPQHSNTLARAYCLFARR